MTLIESTLCVSHRAAAGLVFLGVSVHAATTLAAVIVHDNSAREFVWTIGLRFTDHSELPGNFLDITQPPSQSGERLPGTFSYWIRPSYTSSDPGILFFQGEPGAQTARTSDWVELLWNNMMIGVKPTREYFYGEHVMQPDNWLSVSTYYYLLPHSFSLAGGTPAISVAAYLGVRTQVAGRWHYGWILFTEYLTPAMWAYETTPDTPIEIPIPAPGSACILLAGSLLITRRRRGG